MDPGNVFVSKSWSFHSSFQFLPLKLAAMEMKNRTFSEPRPTQVFGSMVCCCFVTALEIVIEKAWSLVTYQRN